MSKVKVAKLDPASSPSLLRTPLFELSCQQKARFTNFAGWEMAVQYQGLKQEHQAVRTEVGMFDISHMGKFQLQGKNLRAQLQYLVPSDLSLLGAGQSQYTVLLNPQGGIIDDIIFYYQGETLGGEEKGLLIVNAANTSKDRDWILSHLDDKVQFTDLTLTQALIALQGPLAVRNLQGLVTEDLSLLKAFDHLTTSLGGESIFIARTGYTGEDGFEIMAPPATAQQLWQNLLAQGVIPCGLGARDTLRLEAAMALYGQDLDDSTTPWEAGLGWLVHLEQVGEFVGRPVLETQKATGVNRRLVGLQMQGREIARHDYPVIYQGEVVGKITSGTLSPTLGKAIALAYLPTHITKLGQSVEVEIRGKTYPATVVKKPFYRSASRAKR